MLNWFKKKKYPGFWNNYIKHFKSKNPNDIQNTRFVVFDTETTGLDIKNDRILSIGCVSVLGNTIDVATNFEVYVSQDVFNKETVEIHGILKEGNLSKIKEKEAVVNFLEYVKDAVLVAHHAAFDVAMINHALFRLELPKLKNKYIDTGILFKKTNFDKNEDKHYGLDELCDLFNIKKHDRHTASGDAFITSILFLKIKENLIKSKKFTLNDLLFNRKKNGLL